MDTSPTVVIGAGHAGLAVSNLLTAEAVDHTVLERDCVASSWANERWDSFTLLTPNWATWLPGWRYDGDDPHGSMGRDQVVAHLERYSESFAAPVRNGVEVEGLTAVDGDGFVLRTNVGELTADTVVVATPSRPPGFHLGRQTWGAESPRSTRVPTAPPTASRREASSSSGRARRDSRSQRT